MEQAALSFSGCSFVSCSTISTFSIFYAATLEGTTVTVAGLAPGESAELTVTAQRAGRADAPTTVTGEVAQGRPDGPWLIVATATST